MHITQNFRQSKSFAAAADVPNIAAVYYLRIFNAFKGHRCKARVHITRAIHQVCPQQTHKRAHTYARILRGAF